jgi:hypothetical protein
MVPPHVAPFRCPTWSKRGAFLDLTAVNGPQTAAGLICGRTHCNFKRQMDRRMTSHCFHPCWSMDQCGYLLLPIAGCELRQATIETAAQRRRIPSSNLSIPRYPTPSKRGDLASDSGERLSVLVIQKIARWKNVFHGLLFPSFFVACATWRQSSVVRPRLID